MMQEYEFELECSVCETRLSIVVFDSEEAPTHCPMCGSPCEDEWEN